MNRLWIRLSLAFGAAAFISMMLMFGSLFLARTGVPISLIIDELRAPNHDVTGYNRTWMSQNTDIVTVERREMLPAEAGDGPLIMPDEVPWWAEVQNAVPANGGEGPMNRPDLSAGASQAVPVDADPVPSGGVAVGYAAQTGGAVAGYAANAAPVIWSEANVMVTPDTTMLLSLADANGRTVPGYEKGEIFGAGQNYRVVVTGDKGAFRFMRRFQMPVPGPFNSWMNGLLNTMAAAAVVAGIVSVIFGILMSRNLTAPLNRLAEAARAIEARKLSRRARVEGTTEIAAVAQAFNDMADSVQHATTLRQSLVADVAHELRTPLSVLQGNLRAILDDVYPMSKQEISRLYDQTRLLSRLVNDLHELSQAEAHQLPLHVQSFDLAAMLHEQGGMFAALAEDEGIRVVIDAPASGIWIAADGSRLVQVLTNLLSNALAHTPTGGEIRVGLKAQPAGPVLTVSDTGEGIDARHLPYLFERFYRADPGRARSKGGAGLGLAIVRALVQEHGGTIEASSAGAGQGSTFTVRLPASLDAA